MTLLTDEQLYSSSGIRKTRSLFKEFCRPGEDPCLSVSRQEKEGLIRLAPLFIDMVTADPSEYEFAEYVFGSYAHWKLIADAAWMQPYLQEWRMEADVRRKSLAFRTIVTDAQSANRTATTSAKFLIEERWKPQRKKSVKETTEKTSEKAAEGFSEDFIRLRDHLK